MYICNCMNQHSSQILLTFTAHMYSRLQYSMHKHTWTCISYIVLLLGTWDTLGVHARFNRFQQLINGLACINSVILRGIPKSINCARAFVT